MLPEVSGERYLCGGNGKERKLTKDSLFQIKKIDSVGRLYIPLEIRSSLHLMDYGDEVEIYIDNANQIVLKKRCLTR